MAYFVTSAFHYLYNNLITIQFSYSSVQLFIFSRLIIAITSMARFSFQKLRHKFALKCPFDGNILCQKIGKLIVR